MFYSCTQYPYGNSGRQRVKRINDKRSKTLAHQAYWQTLYQEHQPPLKPRPSLHTSAAWVAAVQACRTLNCRHLSGTDVQPSRCDSSSWTSNISTTFIDHLQISNKQQLITARWLSVCSTDSKQLTITFQTTQLDTPYSIQFNLFDLYNCITFVSKQAEQRQRTPRQTKSALTSAQTKIQ